MKIILDSKALLTKLQSISGVIPTNPVLPILESFLFEIVDDKLKVTGSDLDNTISTSLELETHYSDGLKIAIPAKILIDILKAIPHQPLTFHIHEKSKTIDILSSGGIYSTAFDLGDQFPKAAEIQDISSVSIPAKVLTAAIGKTVFAVGTDDLRPAMTGVLFQFSTTGLNFVSTDAHKLVKYSRTDIKVDNEISLVVPRKPLNILKGMLATIESDVAIEYNSHNIKFSFGDYEFSARLIDEKFPKYEAVIPKENPNKMVIVRETLLKSLKCVSIFSNKDTKQVRFKLVQNCSLNVSAEDVDYSNKADENIDCDYQGEDMQIGFNSRFLAEMLANLQSDEIMLEMSIPNRAGIITPVDGLENGESILMLIMPVLLNN